MQIRDFEFSNIQKGIIRFESGDIKNTEVPTKGIMENITAFQNNAESSSLIELLENSKLIISSSNFTENYSYLTGGTLCAKNKNAEISITSSLFRSN